MRIIAGEFRGRKIFSPAEDMATRPIPDRVKESLFGLLRGHCEDASVYDGFAGTGAIGLEAISRGATRCVFVERERDTVEMLRANINLLNAGDRCEVVTGDALGAGALARCPRPVKLVFFDPPYPLVLDPGGWERVKEQFTKLVACLTDDGFAVLRLPHPFIHEFREDGTSVAAPEAARPAPARKKGKGKERFDWRRELEDRKTKKAQAPREDELRLEGDLDEFEDQALLDEVEVAPAHTGPATRKVWPSIAIDGAVGPETHVYRGTAVHLYMRKRSE